VLTRLFDETSERPPNRLQFSVRMVLVNLVAAVACVVCAMVYFGVGFAAGDGPGPVPFSVEMFLWSIVAAVAALGILLGASEKLFPWLTAFLTPLLSGVIMTMTLPGDRDGSSTGLWLGGATSAVFLFGAGAARGYKGWVRVRKSASHQ
jgi:hypothetical protein